MNLTSGNPGLASLAQGATYSAFQSDSGLPVILDRAAVLGRSWPVRRSILCGQQTAHVTVANDVRAVTQDHEHDTFTWKWPRLVREQDMHAVLTDGVAMGFPPHSPLRTCPWPVSYRQPLSRSHTLLVADYG